MHDKESLCCLQGTLYFESNNRDRFLFSKGALARVSGTPRVISEFSQRFWSCFPGKLHRANLVPGLYQINIHSHRLESLKEELQCNGKAIW